MHSNLILQDRLIAGVNFLDELPLQLRRSFMSITDKHISRALYEDAVLLAKYAGDIPQTVAFNDFVAHAME